MIALIRRTNIKALKLTRRERNGNV